MIDKGLSHRFGVALLVAAGFSPLGETLEQGQSAEFQGATLSSPESVRLNHSGREAFSRGVLQEEQRTPGIVWFMQRAVDSYDETFAGRPTPGINDGLLRMAEIEAARRLLRDDASRVVAKNYERTYGIRFPEKSYTEVLTERGINLAEDMPGMVGRGVWALNTLLGLKEEQRYDPSISMRAANDEIFRMISRSEIETATAEFLEFSEDPRFIEFVRGAAPGFFRVLPDSGEAALLNAYGPTDLERKFDAFEEKYLKEKSKADSLRSRIEQLEANGVTSGEQLVDLKKELNQLRIQELSANQELKELIEEAVYEITDLVGTASKPKATNDPVAVDSKLQREEALRFIDTASRVGASLARTISVFDPEAGAAIGSLVGVSTSVAALYICPADPIAWASAVEGIASLFAPRVDIAGERHKQVMEGLGRISSQIEELRDIAMRTYIEMHRRFDEQRELMIRGFESISTQLSRLDDLVLDIKAGQADARERLAKLDVKITDTLQVAEELRESVWQVGHSEKTQGIRECVDRGTFLSSPLGIEQQNLASNYLADLIVYATRTTSTPLLIGADVPMTLASDRTNFLSLLAIRGLHNSYGAIASHFPEYLGVSKGTLFRSNLVPNPIELGYAIAAATELSMYWANEEVHLRLSDVQRLRQRLGLVQALHSWAGIEDVREAAVNLVKRDWEAFLAVLQAEESGEFVLGESGVGLHRTFSLSEGIEQFDYGVALPESLQNVSLGSGAMKYANDLYAATPNDMMVGYAPGKFDESRANYIGSMTQYMKNHPNEFPHFRDQIEEAKSRLNNPDNTIRPLAERHVDSGIGRDQAPYLSGPTTEYKRIPALPPIQFDVSVFDCTTIGRIVRVFDPVASLDPNFNTAITWDTQIMFSAERQNLEKGQKPLGTATFTERLPEPVYGSGDRWTLFRILDRQTLFLSLQAPALGSSPIVIRYTPSDQFEVGRYARDVEKVIPRFEAWSELRTCWERDREGVEEILREAFAEMEQQRKLDANHPLKITLWWNGQTLSTSYFYSNELPEDRDTYNRRIVTFKPSDTLKKLAAFDVTVEFGKEFIPSRTHNGVEVEAGSAYKYYEAFLNGTLQDATLEMRDELTDGKATVALRKLQSSVEILRIITLLGIPDDERTRAFVASVSGRHAMDGERVLNRFAQAVVLGQASRALVQELQSTNSLDLSHVALINKASERARYDILKKELEAEARNWFNLLEVGLAEMDGHNYGGADRTGEISSSLDALNNYESWLKEKGWN